MHIITYCNIQLFSTAGKKLEERVFVQQESLCSKVMINYHLMGYKHTLHHPEQILRNKYK